MTNRVFFAPGSAELVETPVRQSRIGELDCLRVALTGQVLFPAADARFNHSDPLAHPILRKARQRQAEALGGLTAKLLSAPIACWRGVAGYLRRGWNKTAATAELSAKTRVELGR